MICEEVYRDNEKEDEEEGKPFFISADGGNCNHYDFSDCLDRFQFS